MFNKFKSKATGGSTYDYLIVGLGNPGAKYETTRHNAGFLCIENMENELGFKAKKLKFHALIGDTKIANKKVLVMKPQTMMNNSGTAVSECASFYKIPPQNIIVIFDDISLEPGKLRIRRKGSHGGHNGMRSIIELTGKDDFPRIKMGVGKKPHPEYDLAKWVLGKFSREDAEKFKSAAENACECIKLMVQGKTDEAMNKVNS